MPPPDGDQSSSNDYYDTELPTVAAARLVGHGGPIQSICFAGQDGKYCLTGGHDRTVRLWNPHRPDPAYDAASNTSTDQPNSSSITGGGEVSYRYLRNLPRALPIQTYTNGLTHAVSDVCAVGEDDDSQRLLLAACNKDVAILDLVTAQMVRKLSQAHTARVNAVSSTNDAHVYASASYDRTVALWDGRAKNSHKPIQILDDAKDSVTCVRISSSSPVIRTASVDGILRSYDIRQGLMTSDDCCDGSPIISMDVANDGLDGTVFLSCLDGKIRSLGIQHGRVSKTFRGGHIVKDAAVFVSSMADGRFVASGSQDGQVVIYDTMSGHVRRSLIHRDRTKPTCAVATAVRDGLVVSNNYGENDAVVWRRSSLGDR